MMLPHVAGQAAGQRPIHAAARSYRERRAGSISQDNLGEAAPPAPSVSTTRKPLPPVLPRLPPDEALVRAVADDSGVDASIVRGWLAGERRVHGEALFALRRSLWAPIGGAR